MVAITEALPSVHLRFVLLREARDRPGRSRARRGRESAQKRVGPDRGNGTRA